MINLNEQQSEEEKKEDSNHEVSLTQSELLNGKNNSEISQNVQSSKPKQAIIKAIDVPKERDNKQQNEKIEKLQGIGSKIIPKSYSVKQNSQKSRIEAFKKKQASINESNISKNSDLKKQPHSRIQQKPKIEQKKSSSSINEKLPCAFCNLPITFEEMQSHHDSCPQAFTCNKCKDIFPIFLKGQHQNLCIPSSKIKKQSSYLKYYRINDSYEDLGDKQLQLEDFIRQHPQIDPQILRQHFLAEKQNKYEHSEIQKPQVLQLQDNYYDKYNNEYNRYPEYYDNNYGQQQSQGSKIVKGLKQYQIEDLITDFYQKGSNEQKDECSICTKQKIQDQFIIRLPCFHTFHKQCLVPWLQVKSTCPTCKYNLKLK